MAVELHVIDSNSSVRADQFSPVSSSQRRNIGSSASIASCTSFANRSFLSGYADCTDEELQSLSTKFNQELSKINVENEILEKFLIRIQPHTLTGMNLYLDSAQVVAQRVQTMQTMQPALGNKLPSSPSISIPRQTETMSLLSNPTRSTLRHTGASIPKLTIAFRLELVAHEMEELRTSLEQCQAECRVAKFKLKSQIEEKNIAISEILLAKTSLEQNVTGEKTDDTIQKVPAERYFRYFNDLLKNFDQKLGKMKMKITSMRIQLTRLKAQLEQKIELGEMIHPVDFDELRIENKDFVKNLEEKNKYLLGLKRVTGRCNQNLNSKKRYLEELSDKLKTLLDEIQIKEKITKRLGVEELKTQDEINVAQLEYAQIKDTVSNYSAPSIISYAEKKTELQELEKSIRMWRRRVNLQDTTMTLLKRKLKQIKNHEIQDSWFQGSGGSLEDDNFSERTSVAEQMQ